MKTTFLLLLASSALFMAAAECPNACSGHGTCEAYDMCSCDRGWQSADCSERQCAFDFAFVTTPQGDLNMDGDREDNSYKQLSEPGRITINTNTITFARNGLQKGELKVGDGLRLCNENFIVTQLRGVDAVTGTQDWMTTGTDDTTAEITTSTTDNYKRRITEAVLNTRHTQNCGSPLPATSPGTANLTTGGARGGNRTAFAITGVTKGAAGTAYVSVSSMASNFDQYDKILLTCTGGTIYETVTSNVASDNRFGYWVDGVFQDKSIVLTIKAVASSSPFKITVYEPLPETIDVSGSFACSIQAANEHIVYRHLATQARPNGDWEKWKGDFKGTNTGPGRGPTMNTMDAEYLVTGKDYNKGAEVRLGDYGQDEGHYYMECSNQGLCDRSSGVCECFDGYSGRACQRQACPEDCSGHGVCLSVNQLRQKSMTKLPFTCSTTRNSGNVLCDSDIVGDGKLRQGDYIKIGNYPPMKIETIATDDSGYDANYNVSHFIDASLVNQTKKVDKLVLYNHFPETLTYGTEVWQVHNYRLWDAKKNMACKCDPRYTGFDCSERKCPLGDDPLTVDAVDSQKSSTTTDDSQYTQAPEKQTLYIDSDNQGVVGHISLAFEDYFGEVFHTKPIPMEVELSVTCSTGTAFEVTFDASEGLPSSELSRGDQIRIGRDIRFVETVTYVDHNTKTHIKSFAVRDAYLGAITNGEKFDTGHGTGSRIYRQDVSKEIREALLSVPNSRIEGVSVEKIEMTGDRKMENVTVTESNTRAAKASIDSQFVAGDIIRFKSYLRIVKATATGQVDFVGGTEDVTADVYKANTQRYRIKFESGCLVDDHCNHNGVNSYDSDGTATCTLGGSCLCSLPSASNQYHGFGCTRKGKGNDFHGVPRANNHARPYKRSNSGDLPLLQCSKAELYSGKVLAQYGTVSKTSPTKVVFAGSLGAYDGVQVGDEIYIDGQVRTVVQCNDVDTTGTNCASNNVKVDLPFTIYAKSNDDDIVPAGSTVYRVDRLGGVNTKCHATDMPRLTSTGTAWDSGLGALATVGTGASTTDGDDTKNSQTNPATQITVATQDPQEVEIGDRIRVDTGLAANTDNDDLIAGTFMTHTIDRIDYAITAPIGAVTKFTLNEIVSKESSTAGSFVPVTGSNHIVYNDQRGTTENKECSGRGLCDGSSGVCACFKGYTDDDCSRQNALASA